MAERVGFEPTCRLPDKTLSRRPRYDHFGTSPGCVCDNVLRASSAADTPSRVERCRQDANISLYAAIAEERLNELAALGFKNAAGDREAMIEARRIEGADG